MKNIRLKIIAIVLTITTGALWQTNPFVSAAPIARAAATGSPATTRTVGPVWLAQQAAAIAAMTTWNHEVLAKQLQAAHAAHQAAAAQSASKPSPTTPTVRAAAPTPQTPAYTPAGSSSGSWEQLAICEEGGANSVTFGYYGIIPSTWQSMGMTGTAGQYSMAEQQSVALRINHGSIPYAPAGCGNAGYRGW